MNADERELTVGSAASREFPGFSSFYHFHDPLGRAYRGHPEPYDGVGVLRGEIKPRSAVKITWAMGGKSPLDFVQTTGVFVVAFHDRVVALLEEHGFTGWDTYPVAVFDKEGERVEGYHGLRISGRCGEIDHSQSVEVLKRFPALIRPILKGLYFDPDSWDGSDFFMPQGEVGWMFVTEEVRRVMRKARVKNVAFESLGDVELTWMTSKSVK